MAPERRRLAGPAVDRGQRPAGRRLSRAGAVLLAMLACGAGLAGCPGEELPDAPNPPRVRRTPDPGFFDPSPDPSASPGASPGAPTPTPRPTPSGLPAAPRDGKLVKTGSNYLEFLPGEQGGKLLFFAFPYDSRLQPLRNPVADGSATIRIDGVSFSMSALNDAAGGGDLFFYLFPRVGPGSHQIEITAKVKTVTYSGTFTYP